MHKIIANHKQMTNHIFTTGIGTYNTNNANRLGMNIDLIMALVSLYQLSPEKRYLPLRLILFTHALVSSTDFLIFCGFYCFGV